MMIISVLLQTILLASHSDKGSVQAWTSAFQLPTQKRQSKLSSSWSSDSSAKSDEKIYYQRFFYRFRPSSQVDIHDAMVIEERLRYANNNDDATFRPIGPRTLILRNGQVEDGEIGDEFFTLNVHEPSSLHPSASSIESALCTALYLASNPTLCAGTVLELSCQLGLAGLLGCLGAGYRMREATSSSSRSPAEKTVEDDILTLPHENANLLPPQLHRLILTDSDPDMINYAVHNVQNARIPANKVMLDQWDWTVPTPPLQQRAAMSRLGGNSNNAKTGMPSSSASSPSSAIEYQTIVASDVAFSFPEAKQLARTVANALAPSNTFSLSPNDPPLPAPRFVHISPEARDNETPYLHRLLEKGYRMTVDTGFLKLEKIIFGVQTLSLSQADSLQHESAALDEMELEVKHVQESIYQSLTAIHHPDYAGEGSGEIFFPMETGAYS